MTAQNIHETHRAAMPGSRPDTWTRSVFESVDAMDVGRFMGFVTDDVRFQFTGQPEVNGRAATSAYLTAFFGCLDAIRHDLKWQIRHQDTLIVHGNVEYRIGAGTAVASWVTVFQIQGGKIAEYLIFVDSAPLQGLLAAHRKTG